MDVAGVLFDVKKNRPDEDREVTALQLVLKNRFMPSSVVAKRSVFDECGGFDTTLRSSEDRDMWIRIGTLNRIFMLGSPTVLIRKHSHNMSKHANRMKLNMRRVIAKAFNNGVARKRGILFKLKVYSVNHFEVAWMHYDEGRRGSACIDLLRSALTLPFFATPGEIGEPPFFRLRALRRFLCSANSKS
jgi:hypothetical protein